MLVVRVSEWDFLFFYIEGKLVVVLFFLIFFIFVKFRYLIIFIRNDIEGSK